MNFFMADSSDHITGKEGLSPDVTLSKNGGAFAAPSGAVTEIGNGWYSLAGNATDRNTLGEFLLHAEASGADPADEKYTIESHDPFHLAEPGDEMDLIDAPNATAVAAIQSGLATSANQTTINNNILAVPAAVWAVTTRTLSSFGSLAANIWNYLLTAITTAGSIGKLLKDNIDGKVSERGMILPVMQGRVSATIIQDRKVDIVQGDTPRLTFDFNDDYSGWTPYFGAKAKLTDTDYAINPKAATWTDATKGQGYVDLTAAETATAGKYFAEIELRNGTSRLTPIKLTLIINPQVINS
jgi:hypothetical protein